MGVAHHTHIPSRGCDHHKCQGMGVANTCEHLDATSTEQHLFMVGKAQGLLGPTQAESMFAQEHFEMHQHTPITLHQVHFKVCMC